MLTTSKEGSMITPPFFMTEKSCVRRSAHRGCHGLTALAISTTLAIPAALQAQEQDEATRDESGLETIVVTGTASSTGVKKLEASYNIVTANEAEIRAANPKSTADLLKISPGMWPESTGGQTGANIEIAGFPGGGDAPYFTTMLMGSPLYGMPTLSFFETTSIYRLDDTVRSVEILQGGPSVVFAGGQMGATANFLLKTGTETPTGSIGLTYGDENLWRVDGFVGFPVGENWFGSFGGFWRTTDGVRDPEFTADDGGQLTATLKHQSDNGQLTLYARYLDDKNQFITPIPVIQRGADNFSAYPGFDRSPRLTTARTSSTYGSTDTPTAVRTPISPMAVARRWCSWEPTTTTTSTMACPSATGCWPTAATSIPTHCSPAVTRPRSMMSSTTFPPISADWAFLRVRRRPPSSVAARSIRRRASSTRDGGSSTRN
jgi:hypothetical protein